MTDTNTTSNFIRTIIEEDNASGKYGGEVHTRFPPEPNGYLHIGHAKSINLNYGVAQDYSGRSTCASMTPNPVKEEQEYIDGIIEDVAGWGPTGTAASSTPPTTSSSSTSGPSNSSATARPTSTTSAPTRSANIAAR